MIETLGMRDDAGNDPFSSLAVCSGEWVALALSCLLACLLIFCAVRSASGGYAVQRQTRRKIKPGHFDPRESSCLKYTLLERANPQSEAP